MALSNNKNTAAIETVIKNFSVNNELLTENDRNFFVSVIDSTEQGKEVSLNEAEIEIYKAFKSKISLFERTLSEETKGKLLNESISSWFGYFFKGFSEEEGYELIKKIDSIKTYSEALQLKIKIENVISKINNGGDVTHTIANIASFLFLPYSLGGPLTALIKLAIKKGTHGGDVKRNLLAGLEKTLSLATKKVEELEKNK